MKDKTIFSAIEAQIMKTFNYFAQLVLLLLLLALQPSVLFADEERITYIHADSLGSPVAATDEDGDLKWRVEHYPFGGEYSNTETERENDIGYTGKPYDKEIGLSYYGARYYDPAIGRFMGVDPAGVIGNIETNPMMFNRYAYANNNPYKYVDPDGEFVVLALTIGLIAYSAYEGYQEGGASGAVAEASGYNDAVDSYESVKSGDYSGAVYAAASTVCKICKGGKKVAEGVTPNAKQAKNLKRFQKKIPSNSKNNVELRELPNGGVAAQATSPGKAPGSRAVYEKQIDKNGETVQVTKTTYDQQGSIVHVKDKLN